MIRLEQLNLNHRTNNLLNLNHRPNKSLNLNHRALKINYCSNIYIFESKSYNDNDLFIFNHRANEQISDWRTSDLLNLYHRVNDSEKMNNEASASQNLYWRANEFLNVNHRASNFLNLSNSVTFYSTPYYLQSTMCIQVILNLPMYLWTLTYCISLWDFTSTLEISTCAHACD